MTFSFGNHLLAMGMPAMNTTRRLAAILAADVKGYTRLMGADEEGTHARWQERCREIVDPEIREHGGRVFKTTGDGRLAEFGSVLDALRCAATVQTRMAECNELAPTHEQILLRIGIHQGDVIVDNGDLFGDGVNVAARLEPLAEPGGICISGRVQEDVRGRLDLGFDDLGDQQLKNVDRPVRAYRVRFGRDAAGPRWLYMVQQHARPHEGLRFVRPSRRLPRIPGKATAAPERFEIGEKVHLVLDPPADLRTADGALHAVLVAEDAEDMACLFPLESGDSAIGTEPLRLPKEAVEPYEMTGPAGVQHVYAVLTRFPPRSQIHAGLQGADLRSGLDVLANELAGRPITDWRIIGMTVEVVPSKK
jgi:class 3 adenylate cyclase